MTAVGGNCYFSLPLAPSQPHVTFFSLVLCGIEEPYHLTVFRIKSLIQVQIKILWSVDCKHIGRSIIFRSLNNFRMGIFRPLFIFLGFKNTLACSIFLLSMWIESNLRSVWTSGSIKIVYAWYWVLVRYLFAIVRVLTFFFVQIVRVNVPLIPALENALCVAGESSIPCSTCGTPCVLRTANTANNRGRKFYSCSSQACNFFVYVNLNLDISLCYSRKIVKVDWLMQKLLDTSNVYISSLALMRDSFMRGICAWMSGMRCVHFEYSIISPVKDLTFEGLSYSSSGILLSSSSDFILSSAYGNIIFYMMYPICLRRRWEDNLNNGSAPRSAPRPNMSNSASNPSRRGGRGRGVQNAGRAADVTFVSATGEPISGRRCFVCGDPSHFANACPSRGSWCLALSKKSWDMLKYVEDRFGTCYHFGSWVP